VHSIFKIDDSNTKGIVRIKLPAGNTRVLCREVLADGKYSEKGAVSCITPIEVKERAFHAYYYGPKEELFEFYEIIRGINPLH